MSIDKEKVNSRLEYRYGLDENVTGECPYCHSPLLEGMTVCPKCRYDINTPDGGEEHRKWLEKPAPSDEKPEDQKGTKGPKGPEGPEGPEHEIVRPEDVMITSLDTISEYELTEHGGLVFAEIFTKADEASIFAVNEDNIPEYGIIRNRLIEKLQTDASSFGANAVIDVTYSSSIEEGYFHMMMYGTAVWAEKSKDKKKGDKGQGAGHIIPNLIMKLTMGKNPGGPGGPMPF